MRAASILALAWAASASALAIGHGTNGTVVLPRGHPPFRPPSGDDRRSPCPGLNSLANHGLLPHDGKDLDVKTIVDAVVQTYNLSPELATTLASGGVLLTGHDGKLNLDDLDAHGKIEHDASFVHHDFSTGDDHTVDPKLVTKLLSFSADGVHMTPDDFANARASRESYLPGGTLRDVPERVAGGESVFAFHVFMDHDGKGANVEWLRTWFGEEKLPKGWTTPQHQQTLQETTGQVEDFKNLVDSYRSKYYSPPH